MIEDPEVRRLALAEAIMTALEAYPVGWPDEGRVIAEVLTLRNAHPTTIRVHDPEGVIDIGPR